VKWDGYTEMVKYLLDQGADPHALDESGGSVIHLAALRGERKIVEYFVGLGVDYKLENDAGKMPLDLCELEMEKTHGHSAVGCYLQFLIEQSQKARDDCKFALTQTPIE
jgi:hypothetical protein